MALVQMRQDRQTLTQRDRRDEAAAPGTSSTRPDRLPALTGLRAAVAVLVVLFHFLSFPIAPPGSPWHSLTRLARNIVASGYTGVSFFFVLSGFILAYNYLDGQGHLRKGWSHFWEARFARIYPIYLFALLAAFIPYVAWSAPPAGSPGSPHFVPTLVLSPVLLQGWLPFAPMWNPPSWSLSAEAFFYLLFPLLVPLVTRLSRRSLLVLAAVAFWGLSAAVVVGYVIIAPDPAGGPWYAHHWLRILYDNPLVRLPEFVLGAIAARLFALRPVSVGPAMQRAARRAAWRKPGLLPRVSPTALSLVVALAIVALWCLGPLPVALGNQVILDPLYALLIYTMAYGRGPLVALFSLPAVVLLGEASYSLYILQWPVHDWMAHLVPATTILGALPSALRDHAYFVVYLCVLVAVALLAYRCVERPAQKAIRRIFARMRTRGADEASAAPRPATQTATGAPRPR